MAKTIQQIWPAATSPNGTGKWSERSQRGRQKIDMEQSLVDSGSAPRTFAEFPFDRSWHEVAIHAQRLHGASRIVLFGRGGESWLGFAYMGEIFTIREGGRRVALVVDDCDCPESIPLTVQSHFAEFLSSQ